MSDQVSHTKTSITNTHLVEPTSPLPDHLIRLPGGRWAVWRCAGLRGAGFPAQQVLELAASECAAAAERLIQAKDELIRARNAAQDALHRELEITTDTEKREALKKALRRVSKTKSPEPLEFTYAGKTAVDAFCQARLQADTTQADFERAFAAAIAHTSTVIYHIASTERFREAITWQNRHALVTGVHPILRKPPGTSPRGSQQRQHEELVANYLQRYCVKNDTVGFFGPVGWASFVSHGPALVAHPQPDFLASRTVYFEGWCIDALAETLGRNEALRPWLAPRRAPSIHLDERTLYLPFKDPFKISAGQAAALQACDNGRRTAKEIAQQLIHTPSLGLESETQVYDLLKQLENTGLIVWALQVPLETYPERTLRRLLERIQDPHLRRLNLSALDVLEKARSAVAQAAGDADKLDQALKVMNTIFSRLTGASPSRAEGKTYAARTVVYEDCRRNIQVDIGPEILQTLGPPLSLLLDSARWFIAQAAIIYRQIVRQVYSELSAQTGSPTIPLVDAWPRLQAILYARDNHPLQPLLTAFQERWARILAIPAGARRLEYNSQELQPRLLETFGSSQPDWPSICYHSPDVMIAAPSAQAICRGDYQLVMGELHMTRNTLEAAFFVAQHPSPEELYRGLMSEHPEPRVIPLAPKHWPELTARTNPALSLPHDLHLIFDDNTPCNPEWQTLPIGDMIVKDDSRGPVIQTRDGQLCFDAIEFIAELVTSQTVDYFKILSPDSHTHRVTIDRLVVCRETWRFPVEELTFAYEKEETDRFLAARRWMQQHDLPRFVFAKTPIERKPFYVDFDSSILVNILAKYIRRTKEQGANDARLTITEMLPDPFNLWLPDAQDQRYTGELRIIALEPEAIVHS